MLAAIPGILGAAGSLMGGGDAPAPPVNSSTGGNVITFSPRAERDQSLNYTTPLLIAGGVTVLLFAAFLILRKK